MNRSSIMTNIRMLIKQALIVFITALKLGFISFGGPTAHLVYFQDEYVKRKKWLNDEQYNELVALAQFLPGPTSSQVGIAIGALKAGILGGVLAFIGFTLPSMLALIAFASYIDVFDTVHSGAIKGLKLVAIAMVLHIVIGMVKSILKNYWHWIFAAFSFLLTFFWATSIAQPAAIILAMLLALFTLKTDTKPYQFVPFNLRFSKAFATLCLAIFVCLLLTFPIVARLIDNSVLLMADQFFRSGALVFGGGHIVLPLLEREIVLSGQLSAAEFFAGYSAAQAIPGPLFTFASYIGFMLDGLNGAVLATIFIFLPALLLIFGTLPFWNALRQYLLVARAFKGASCAVVGILASSFIDPIVVTSITHIHDALLSLVLFLLLHRWSCPAWLIVLIALLLGVLFL